MKPCPYCNHEELVLDDMIPDRAIFECPTCRARYSARDLIRLEQTEVRETRTFDWDLLVSAGMLFVVLLCFVSFIISVIK